MLKQSTLSKEKEKQLQNNYYRFAYFVLILALSGLLFFLQKQGFAWEASLFAYTLMITLPALWFLYRYIKTKEKENLFLIMLVIALWGIPLLSNLTKGK